jgi:3-deoxy-D-manno-octulosonic-acid transferase
MIRFFYSLLLRALVPFLRQRLLKRGVDEPGYLMAINERFGHYTQVADAGFIWLHAVSLGETRAAAVLVTHLRERLPGMRLLLTHGTATGRAEGRQLMRPGDQQVWQPWDTPAAVQRFLDHFKPRIGILMETEIWPNLVYACGRADVPLVLVNARLSEKSLRWAQWLAWLARPAYRGLTAVWAQTQADAARFAELGVNVTGVLGNLKFDATPNAEQLATGRVWHQKIGCPVILLASSRDGEELALLEILKSLRAKTSVDAAPRHDCASPDAVQWLIVPRHPQRFDAVAALIEAQGFRVSRRSQWSDAPHTASGTGSGDQDIIAPTKPSLKSEVPSIWLGDSLGEMALYYGLADVALLGGSFEPLGGQNLIEAAACGCPVLMGPHTFNFGEAAELAQASGAALRVGNLTEAVAAAGLLTQNDVELQAARQAALAFASAHQGATERLCQGIEQVLAQAGTPPR